GAVAPRVVPGDEDGGQLRARQPLRPARVGEGTTASLAHAVLILSEAHLAPIDPEGGHLHAWPPELVREGFGTAGGRFGIAVTVSGRVEHLVPARAELDRGAREAHHRRRRWHQDLRGSGRRGVLVEERAEEAAGDQQRGQRALHGAAWLRRAAPRAGAEGGAVFVGAAMSVGAAVASLGAGLSHAPRGLVVGRGVAVVSVSSEAMRRASRVTSTPTTAPPRAMRTGRVLPKSP